MTPQQKQQAIFQADLLSPQKLILLALLFDETPSAERLEAHTGYTWRTIYRATRGLKLRGLLTIQRRGPKPAIYRVDWQRLRDMNGGGA